MPHSTVVRIHIGLCWMLWGTACVPRAIDGQPDVENHDHDATVADVGMGQISSDGSYLADMQANDNRASDTEVSDSQVRAPDLICIPNCVARNCGDDDCGGSCGMCEGQDECVDGVCACQPDCAQKDCGDDGCEGSCGTCNIATQYCGPAQTCVSIPCETAVCGACDEIDIYDIDSYEGNLGTTAHVGINLSAAVFRNWPITAELKIAFTSGVYNSTFTVDHFPGDSWSPYTNPNSSYVGDGAGMVVCWHKVASNGIHCKVWDWWTMERGGLKDYDWPAARPVAHMLFSVEDQERTNIKYFNPWPFNNVSAELASTYNTSTVGTALYQRTCR